jgi:hypothetical protein
MMDSPAPTGNPGRFFCDHSAERALADDGIVRAIVERSGR